MEAMPTPAPTLPRRTASPSDRRRARSPTAEPSTAISIAACTLRRPPNTGGGYTNVYLKGAGVLLHGGGLITNGGALDTKAEIVGGLAGVDVTTAAGTVRNFGTIRAQGTNTSTGIVLAAGGSVTNGSASNHAALITWVLRRQTRRRGRGDQLRHDFGRRRGGVCIVRRQARRGGRIRHHRLRGRRRRHARTGLGRGFHRSAPGRGCIRAWRPADGEFLQFRDPRDRGGVGDHPRRDRGDDGRRQDLDAGYPGHAHRHRNPGDGRSGRGAPGACPFRAARRRSGPEPSLRRSGMSRCRGRASDGDRDDRNLVYAGVWDQTGGTTSVAAGSKLTFDGVGDSFSGTVTGSRRRGFLQGLGHLPANSDAFGRPPGDVSAATVTLSRASHHAGRHPERHHAQSDRGHRRGHPVRRRDASPDRQRRQQPAGRHRPGQADQRQ